MNDPRPHLTPGPEHPITVGPHTGHVVVRAGGAVVAETDAALELHEAHYPVVLYLPEADVAAGRLAPSDQHSWCPYKGEASYHDLRTDAGDLPGAVWCYPEPSEAVAAISGHVAFYADRVEITTSAP